MTQNQSIPMGTMIRVTREGALLGNIGRIYGRCADSALYNIWAPRGKWWGENIIWSSGNVRALDFNLYPSEFEVIWESG